MQPAIKLTLPQAIARQEGFLVYGSRAERNNNPGNLRGLDEHGNLIEWLSKEFGIRADENGYAVFKTVADGWRALSILLTGPIYKGMTVRQALNKYAPAADGNAPAVYVENVCLWCGCTPDTIIDTLMQVAA